MFCYTCKINYSSGIFICKEHCTYIQCICCATQVIKYTVGIRMCDELQPMSNVRVNKQWNL